MDHRPLEAVDAIVVPGGGLATRPQGAAELYHQGISQKILTFDVERSPDQELGITPTQQEATRKLLEALLVPESALVTIGSEVASTWDEVLATRDWCEEHRPRSLAVMTDPFPSRRVAWAFRRGLRDLGVEIRVVPTEQKRYHAGNWWQDESGLIAFQNELIKFGYYRLKYRGGAKR